MIRVFSASQPTPFIKEGAEVDWEIPPHAVWVDLVEPTRDEELAVERDLGFEVPTREEMVEIEASSRLYRQEDVTFATVDLLHRPDGAGLGLAPVTFVVSGGPLVTVRYTYPKALKLFEETIERDPSQCATAVETVLSLFEAVIDRTADIIEGIAKEVDALSEDIFSAPGRTNFTRAIQRLGRAQHDNAKVADSLSSLGRALTFLSLVPGMEADKDASARLRTLGRDVTSLTTHTAGVAQSVNFQLSAALGLINIEQSGIIKIFSVAAVAFLPPTLIASIYGMNFEHMPELHLPWAYPLALIAMVLSAILPLVWFRKKGWL